MKATWYAVKLDDTHQDYLSLWPTEHQAAACAKRFEDNTGCSYVVVLVEVELKGGE